MRVSVSDLSEQAQRQTIRKLAQREREKTEDGTVKVDGIKFRDRRAAARYVYLVEQAQNGRIMELHVQEEVTLAENMRIPGGGRIKAVVWTADFSYIVAGGNIREYESLMPVSKKTRAMLHEKGIRLREVF